MHPTRDISVHQFAGWVVGPLAIVAALFWVANHIGRNVFAVKTEKTDCVPNERFVNDPDGRRFLELRWLMDPPGWRVRLRAPAEYVTWADVGCESATMPGYPDPNYTKPFAQGFAVGLSLPDFKPLPPADRNIDRNGVNWSKMVIHIDTMALLKSESKKNHFIEDLFFSVRQYSVNPKHGYLKDAGLSSGQKQDKFELKRFGVIGDLDKFKYKYGRGETPDLYFVDRHPIDLWFDCDAEEIRDHTEDAAWSGRPECYMYIRHTRLDAQIKVLFPRIYMPMWPQIKVRTEWLLDSFEIGELNDGKL